MHARLAVVLARGLGTRLRAEEDAAALDAAQAAVAATGAKGLMPIAGRPMLDYLLSALADAGVSDVVLVVPPGDTPLRTRYESDAPPTRLRLRCAVQAEPRGTADALLSARDAVCAPLGAVPDADGHRHFLMCNADNLYEPAAIQTLVEADGPGCIAYDGDALVREGGLEPERLARFAVIDVAPDGTLRDIIEKPTPTHPALQAPHRLISMNLWRFTDGIFAHCAAVRPSPRGELELADAVRAAIGAGERFTTHRRAEAVLDLTHRRDVQALEARLGGRVPRP